MGNLRVLILGLLCWAMLALAAPGPEKVRAGHSAPISLNVETTLSPGIHEAALSFSDLNDTVILGQFTVPTCPMNSVPVVNIILHAPSAEPGTIIIFSSEGSVHEYSSLEVHMASQSQSIGINPSQSKDTISVSCRGKGRVMSTPALTPPCKSRPTTIIASVYFYLRYGVATV